MSVGGMILARALAAAHAQASPFGRRLIEGVVHGYNQQMEAINGLAEERIRAAREGRRERRAG